MKKLLIIICFLLALKSYSQIVDVTEIELNFSGDSNPTNITKGLTKIYFSADDGINGTELWVYDTITQNTHLVLDLNSSSNSGLYSPIFLVIGDILYFVPDYSDGNGSKLWRSDGTEAGTYIVKQLNSNSSALNTIDQLFKFNDKVIFTANDGLSGIELWISDGTTNGTTILKDINTNSASSSSFPSSFVTLNGLLFFVANDGVTGNEIWKSDGTTSGTMLMKDIYSGLSGSNNGSNFIVFNNSLYFYANDGSGSGYELWKTDGTDMGTMLIKDIAPGLGSSNTELIGISANDYFVFRATSPGIGNELWKSDGTSAGTVLVKDINPGVSGSLSFESQFATIDNKVYFTADTNNEGEELWSTDGTSIGTLLVKDIRPGYQSSNILGLTAIDNYLLFTASDGSQGYNLLWKSDGTASGTNEFSNLNMQQYSNTELKFIKVNNSVFFAGGDNDLNGNEMYTTDGVTNPVIFKDIFHRYAGMTNFDDCAILGNNLIYTGNNGNGNEPFVTDGTISGTHAIKDINAGSGSPFFTSAGYRSASYTKAGNYVFFRANNGVNGYEIWKTDGTEANTTIVKDIKVGSGNAIDESMLFMSYNGIFYFKATDGTSGNELWRSDGTSIGTYMVKDINPGSGSALDGQSNIYYNSEPPYRNDILYAVLNGYLYFTAYDGTNNAIWKTDGTSSGTSKVITMPQEGTTAPFPHILGSANNKIFFYSYKTLYSTDGTQSGTSNLITFTSTSYLYGKTLVFNNDFYFIAFGATTYELWKTNGTAAGTTLVKDGLLQGGFNSLTTCGNNIYFTLGFPKKELWRTDGTTLGTIKLGDLTSTNEYFYGCNTCHQGNLIFKRANEDKIYYANGSSTNVDNYLTTNIVNSENFGEIGYFFYSSFYDLNGTLLFAAVKEYGGYELYSSDFDINLNNNDFENGGAKCSIVIYPNPAKNNINFLSHNGEVVLKATLYDLLGKQVFCSEIFNNELQLSGVDNGLYIIKITTDKSQYNSKIVIKK